MRTWVLGSGSEGNAVLVECGESRILIDAGFGTRTISGRLKSIGVSPGSIEACIITHEHGDHARGAAAGARRWGWALFASTGTVSASDELRDANCTSVPVGSMVTLSRATLTTYAVPHDAASPIGVRVTSTSSGTSTVVCTDLGHANDSVRALCRDADILIVESNHDDALLRSGPYPPSVQARIASRVGHLSNRACAALTRDAMHLNLAHVVLAHLSEQCNDHGVARSCLTDVLSRTRFRGMTSVAMQHGALGPFLPRASRVQAPEQFSFAF
ncbi:MAG: MBL fold metallo-hydrolase [Gemmatimonadota bacterium]|nr:MBL fold metallo-hydrolase [Gemmatimonadota bacterium]